MEKEKKHYSSRPRVKPMLVFAIICIMTSSCDRIRELKCSYFSEEEEARKIILFKENEEKVNELLQTLKEKTSAFCVWAYIAEYPTTYGEIASSQALENIEAEAETIKQWTKVYKHAKDQDNYKIQDHAFKEILKLGPGYYELLNALGFYDKKYRKLASQYLVNKAIENEDKEMVLDIASFVQFHGTPEDITRLQDFLQ